MVGYLVVQWAASTVERLVGWKVEKKAVNLVEKKVVKMAVETADWMVEMMVGHLVEKKVVM